MSLNFGREQLSIPGPSVIPDRVLAAMHRPSPNIYEGALVDMMPELTADLCAVARTTGDVAIYIGNGHAAWEAALANLFAPGDHVLVLSTGRFGAGWAEMARTRGVAVEVMDFGFEAAAAADQVLDRLRADKDHQIRAVLTVQTDTASGVRNDIAALGAAIKDSGHPALFLVDCICSLGCEPFEMDAWGVDVMVSACQKGLMVPAGLAFVFVGPRAHEARQKVSPSQYWDWTPRITPDYFYQRFDGTAPTHHLFGLREALQILLHEEGLEAAWARHAVFARAVWAAINAWGADGAMWINIADPADRSTAVTAISTQPEIAGKIRRWCEMVGGLTLGIGLGRASPDEPEWNQYFRIGHMGHLNVPMVMGALGTIDASLKAQNLPHGPGALDAASAQIADDQSPVAPPDAARA